MCSLTFVITIFCCCLLRLLIYTCISSLSYMINVIFLHLGVLVILMNVKDVQTNDFSNFVFRFCLVHPLCKHYCDVIISDGDSNHRRLDCLLNRLFRRRSKKTSKPSVTALCEGNPPVTGGFPSQRSGDAEDVSIWWRHPVLGRMSSRARKRSELLKLQALKI